MQTAVLMFPPLFLPRGEIGWGYLIVLVILFALMANNSKNP
jgi:hypothetical protein